MVKKKKDMTIQIRQQDDGGWIAQIKTGFRKNETVVAEEMENLLKKVSDKISKHYKGYGVTE